MAEKAKWLKFACRPSGIYHASMTTAEILAELPKLTKTERQEIRLRLAELDSVDWLDDEEPLMVHEEALLEARLAAYAKDPDAGSTWEEVESRIRARTIED
jgi:putative addiction module component (TIGR02574 family)